MFDLIAGARRQVGIRSRPAAASRAGYTLIEILLVLALLVIIGGIVMSSLAAPLDNHRLRKSADLVRSAWGRARVKAMKTGQIQIFRYELGGNQFYSEPWFRAEDLLELGGQPMAGGTVGGPTGTFQAAIVTPVIPTELPDRVVFESGQAMVDSRTEALSSAASGPSGQFGTAPGQSSAVANAGGTWSNPILFYPDGTSSTAQVTLANARGYYVMIQLRGLTGLSRATDLMSADEMLTGRP